MNPISLVVAAMAMGQVAEVPRGAIKVEVVQTAAGGWQLLRGGEPYFVRGVGGTQRMAEFAALGGNSMRTWGVDRLGEELDEAYRHGLTIAAGIWLGHVGHGFDWNDPEQIQRQRDAVREAVLKYRDHPALLLWGLGNEMEINNDNPTLWREIGYLAQMVEELDPNHPTMTVVAEIGGPEKTQMILEHAPALDILGINSYGGLISLGNRLKERGFTKPYLVTEFGPLGPWERPRTEWGAALEQTSSEKAATYRDSYAASVLGMPGMALGAYAFLWGDKQEATPTWFGMTLPTGEMTEAVDVMTEFWTGQEPTRRAPRIASLDWKGAPSVAAGTNVSVNLEASDPDGDPLTYEWKIRPEIEREGYAGEGEITPERLDGLVDHITGPVAEFVVPSVPGAYRLYVIVRDGTGRAGAANIPFQVR